MAQELERLDHVRVKKTPKDFPDRKTRRDVRNSALERICRRRTRRQAGIQGTGSTSSHDERDASSELSCPVCEESVDEQEFQQHVDTCLATRQPSRSNLNRDDDDDDLDIDSDFGLETYTWAGQTRVRATAPVLRGFRGQGFVSITRGNEDDELDIEGDGESGQKFGGEQYTEADLILPKPETKDERADIESRTNIQRVLLGQTSKVNDDTERKQHNNDERASTSQAEAADDNDNDNDDLTKSVERLKLENAELKQKSMCNICMDVYNRPVVSTLCWHVSCEECWLRALGSKKLCPQCKVIIQPKDLRRIFL